MLGYHYLSNDKLLDNIGFLFLKSVPSVIPVNRKPPIRQNTKFHLKRKSVQPDLYEGRVKADSKSSKERACEDYFDHKLWDGVNCFQLLGSEFQQQRGTVNWRWP